MTILAIQNTRCEGLGTLERLLKEDGYDAELVLATEDTIPAIGTNHEGVIILGGPVSVYDDLDFLKREQNVIRKATSTGTPVLGICLGSQLIAQALGGQVYPGKTKEIGWSRVDLTQNGNSDIFSGIEEDQMLVFQWHGDTYSLPPNAIILARNALYPQAFRIGSAVGIQFHLEVQEKMVREWAKEYHKEMGSQGIRLRDIIPTRDMEIELELECTKVYRNFELDLRKRRKYSHS